MPPHDTIPTGYCQCGCGNKTKLAQHTNARTGRIKGEPNDYLFGHQPRTGLGRDARGVRKIHVSLDNPRVAIIPLSQGQQAVIDVDDMEFAQQYGWYIHGGYATTKMRFGGDYRGIRLHRALMGVTDPRVHIDHINGDRLDNRRSNIRIASVTENQRNRTKLSVCKSGYKGVAKHSQCDKWQANITSNKGRVYLGLFDSAEEAAIAFDSAAREFHGEFATVNFPQPGERSAITGAVEPLEAP